MIRVTWDEIKDLSVQTKTPLRYVLRNSVYIITLENWAWCKINQADATEFEADFKPTANQPFNFAKDGDGAQMVNPKIATGNRRYQSIFANFTTAKFGAKTARDHNNNELSVFLHRIYKADGSLITSSAEENLAVLTVLEWEPTQTYDIQGFCLYQQTQPTSDMFLSAVAAWHIPPEYGGSIVSVQGCNLKYAPFGNREVDWVGDSASTIQFDPVNDSHHQIIKIYHDPGVQHNLMAEVIWYV